MKLTLFIVDAVKSICAGAKNGGAEMPCAIYFDVAVTGDLEVAQSELHTEISAPHRVRFSCPVDWQNVQAHLQRNPN